jgi:alpha-maltose-1-phosphate synthase
MELTHSSGSKGSGLRDRTEEKCNTVLLIDSDGLSDYTCYLARGLVKYRNILLYGFSKESYIATGAATEKNIKFYYIKEKLPKGYSSARGIARVFLLFFILFKPLFGSNYEIVHVQEHLPTFFLFLPILKLRRKRIYWTLHDTQILNPDKGIMGKLQIMFLRMVSQPSLMARFADKILVHSIILKKQLVDRKVNQGKIHVIRHFDYRYLLQCVSEDNPGIISGDLPHDNYVLFFGDVTPWKGIDILIKASRICRKQIGNKFNLLIAGKSFYGKNFDGLLTDKDREYAKILDKYVTSDEIPALLGNSLFVVLPYTCAFKHSVSGVIPLAYTFSKPVIASDVSTLTEYVEEDKTGLIFESGNSEHLADCILDLIENKDKRMDMGKRAYQKVIEEMSLENCSETINKLYLHDS